MENQELLAGMGSLNSIVASDGDGLEHMSNGVKETENLGDHLLEDLDLYLEDINDRLTISRMVSDSVIRGMVNAVEQEASDKISAKDSELNCLKKKLYINQGAVDTIKYSGLPVARYQPRNAENGRSCSFSGNFWEHDNMRGSLSNIRSVAWEQIKKLKKEIDGIRGCNSIRRNSSGSELIGLGEILQEKVSESWVGIDKTLDALKNAVDTICMQVDDVLQLDKASLCEWQQEQEFQGEIEAIVIRNCIRSLQEEFEEKLWDQNARFCSIQSLNWHEKISKIAGLQKELDAVLKSLPGPETGQLISHGSYDADHFNRKALSNQVSSSNSLWEGNGKLDESKANMPENLDAAQLKHMSKEEMVNYFNQMITEMKRNHESILQGMIEENFALKREYLRNRGKFDILRRKIPDVMLKLDSILVENEKLPLFTGNSDGLGSLRGQFENLLLENKQLRDSLMDKKKEVKYLSSKVSDAAEKMLQHSSTEMQLLQLIGNLKSCMEDASIEASVSEEVYKCILREVSVPINHGTKESELQPLFMKDLSEVFFGEAARSAEVNSKCEIEDSDIESLIMEGLCGVVYKGAIEVARSQLNHLNTKYLGEIENRASFEMNALKTEDELMQEVKEKEMLKQEVLLLEALVTEKEKIANEVSAAFEEGKKQFKLASQELQNLRDESSLQKTLISDYKKELASVKGDLAQALGQIEAYKLEVKKLSQKLELTLKEFVEADEERNMLQSVTQEKQNDLLLFQLKEKEQRKQMQEIIVLVHGLSKTLADFEFRVAEGIERNNLRLEFSGSQMSSLIQKANAVIKTHFVCKQRLEKRCSDLQMAEAEVDLLGDEVDALLSLLEKIYIALDHYSPVLQHYPGIIETLKLVRRELSGESTKPV